MSENTQLSTPQNQLAFLAGANLETTDPDKIEKLWNLHQSALAIQARKEFFSAFAAFQSEMPAILKEKQGMNYKYASYEDIMRVARPILQKHGLATSFAQSENDTHLTVVCRVSHTGGHTEETPFTLPKDGQKMTKDGRPITTLAQAQGDANTYAKRYCLCNALDIVVTGDDRDMQPVITTISAKQSDELNDMLFNAPGGTLEALLEWAGVTTLAELPSAKFNTAKKAVAAKMTKP
jgi:hypothetical protein